MVLLWKETSAISVEKFDNIQVNTMAQSEMVMRCFVYLNVVLQYLGSNIPEAMFNYMVLKCEKVPVRLLEGQLNDVETCTNILQQTEAVWG